MTRWLLSTALALAFHPALIHAQSVDFDIASKLNVNETELPYRLNLDLSVAAPTRIGVDALLDLREIQKLIPERTADQAVIDNCGLQVKIDGLTLKGEADAILLDGDTTVNLFECGRTSERDFHRGDLKQSFQATLDTSASVSLRDNCVFFEIRDLTLSSPEAGGDPIIRNETLQDVKDLLLAAIGLILNDAPLCPTLPKGLASLDPKYDEGGPQEIGEGGMGVMLKGSVDVSTSTILDILTVLQEEDVLPGRP